MSPSDVFDRELGAAASACIQAGSGKIEIEASRAGVPTVWVTAGSCCARKAAWPEIVCRRPRTTRPTEKRRDRKSWPVMELGPWAATEERATLRASTARARVLAILASGRAAPKANPAFHPARCLPGALHWRSATCGRFDGLTRWIATRGREQSANPCQKWPFRAISRATLLLNCEPGFIRLAFASDDLLWAYRDAFGSELLWYDQRFRKGTDARRVR